MKVGIRDMTIIGLFVALMIAGAFIKIPNPLYPTVPITFQLFFCIYAGLLLSGKNAFYSQLIYMLIGLIGIPVFANGGGFWYILNPTFGYIIGFLVGATFIGYNMKKLSVIIFSKMLMIVTFGFIMIYIIGNIYMYLILHLYMENELTLLSIGIIMIPYMIKDYILAFLAVITAKKVIPYIRKAGY